MNFAVNVLTPGEWDGFAQDAGGHFMQSHGWGQFQASLGWQPHYCVLQAQGVVQATTLLLSRRVPGLPFALFHAPRGPNVRDARVNHAEFGEGLRDYVRKHHGVLCRMDPYWREAPDVDARMDAMGFQHLPDEWSFWNAPKFVLWLPLERPVDEVFAGMDRNCQRDVKAGYKKSVEFVMGTEADLPDFHRLLVSMSNSKGIAFHDAAYFERLMRSLDGSVDVGLFLAKYEGKTVSVGMSLRYGQTSWLLYAASDREHYKLRINRNIQWEMIKWAHEKGCTRYDFRGTATGDPPSPSDAGYGVYEFKKSFGPEFTRLCGYYDMRGTSKLYDLSRLLELRGVPLAYSAKVRLAQIRNPPPKASE